MYIPGWFLVVIIFVCLCYYYAYKKRKNRFDEFSPFYVHILPMWYKIFKEYNLIKNEDAWDEIVRKIDKDEKSGNPLSQGICFTILKQDEKKDLVYLNNYNTFHSEVNFRFRITEIKMKNSTLGNSRLFDFSPTFYIKSSIEGYEIGITTPESSSKVFMVGDDNDLIKISMIPYGLFRMPRYRFGILTKEQLKQKLEKDNWKLEEQDAEARLANLPIALENAYFTVNYKYV